MFLGRAQGQFQGGEVLSASRNPIGASSAGHMHSLVFCSFCLVLSQANLAILVARTSQSKFYSFLCQTGSSCGWWGQFSEKGVWLSDTPNRHHQTHDLTLEATPQPLGHTIPVLKRWIPVTRRKATIVLRCTHPRGASSSWETTEDSPRRHQALPSGKPSVSGTALCSVSAISLCSRQDCRASGSQRAGKY